jgi:hypothetical protein
MSRAGPVTSEAAMPRKWLESLDETARAQAEALIEQLRGLGCRDPELWARREYREHLPQVSRWLLLHSLWSVAIDAWRDSLLWADNLIEDSREDPDAPFAEAGRALQRLREAGASLDDIAELARFVAYESVFSAVHTLDEGYDTENDADIPGWALIERDPLGHVTGRALTRLHEDLPGLERVAQPPPSGE